jgi:hypothetical protein
MHLQEFALSIIVVLMAGCTTSPAGTQRTTLQPTTTPTIAPTSTNTVPKSNDAAVNAARLRLSHEGMENPELVSVVSVTPTSWPDDCLGLPSGLTCHSKATAGYLIELEKDGQHYLFHTDQDGKQVRLARSPIAPISDAFIQWQYLNGQECRTAVIGIEEMRYGMCGEAMLAASSRASMWPNIKGQSQAGYLKQTYAPFRADTIHGTLVFSGTGTLVASAAEQRAIAEWALYRWQEADVRYLSADIGLGLGWQERTPSRCGGLWIYQTGLAIAWNCEGTEALGVGFLSATQLQQFYEWLDSGKQWNINPNDQVNGVSPKTVLHFPWSDLGERTAADDTESVLRFAHEVYAGLTAGVPKR